MEYSVIVGGNEFPLKPYAISVAEEIERIEASNNKEGKFREKLKSMYDFLLRTVEGAEEHLGNFNECDPNIVNIMYFKVLRAYNSPLEDYQREQSISQFDDEAVKKAATLLELMAKVEERNPKK